MFTRLLVPLDFTEKNDRALDVAFSLARQARAEVMLLHVIETVEHLPFDELRHFYEKLAADARSRMARAAERYGDERRAVTCEIVFGKRGVEIVRFAKSNDCDLIVLSSHAVDEQRAPPVGTISHQVAVLALCSVLLVK